MLPLFVLLPTLLQFIHQVELCALVGVPGGLGAIREASECLGEAALRCDDRLQHQTGTQCAWVSLPLSVHRSICVCVHICVHVDLSVWVSVCMFAACVVVQASAVTKTTALRP